jgi:hypothetical protein
VDKRPEQPSLKAAELEATETHDWLWLKASLVYFWNDCAGFRTPAGRLIHAP